MSTTRPIRHLDAPTGIRVYVLSRPRDGYVWVENTRTGRTFETPHERLHKAPEYHG